MIDIAYQKQMKQVKRGVFLTVEYAEELNTMTIGWFQLGYFWSREVMTVGVRQSRYTHDIIGKADYYSVTIPQPHQFADELLICGSKSGRDIDKFKVCNLPVSYHGDEKIPYIAIPGEHLFGKIVYKTTMEEHEIGQSLDRHYPKKDFHTLYISEIIDRLIIS